MKYEKLGNLKIRVNSDRKTDKHPDYNGYLSLTVEEAARLHESVKNSGKDKVFTSLAMWKGKDDTGPCLTGKLSIQIEERDPFGAEEDDYEIPF